MSWRVGESMKSVSSRFNLTQNLLEIYFIPGLGRAAGEGRLPIPVFLGSPGVSDGKESAYSPWGRKELDTTEQVSLFLQSSHGISLSSSQRFFSFYTFLVSSDIDLKARETSRTYGSEIY